MTSFVRELMSHLRSENQTIQNEAIALQTEGVFYALKTKDEKLIYNEKVSILRGKAEQLERIIDIINSII